VQAAPGSGKTACIVQRIRALLAEGVKPKELLSLTFTKEASKEMTERAELECEEKIFSTFHSWALAFIKREAHSLPFKVKTDWHGMPAPLLLPLESTRVIAQICRTLPDRVQWKDAQSFVSRMKRSGITPEEAHAAVVNDGEYKFILAYQRYEKALRDKGVMDFDSIIIETSKLLRSDADVRMRNQYRFVQVDEAQDTDEIQAQAVKCITEAYGNVIWVGDTNQNMYSWRGAVGNLEAHVLSLFSDVKILPLAVNYRSTQAIVDYCKEIAPNQNASVTDLTTPNETGVAPTFRLYTREDEEAEGVILSCQDVSNTAILARTNRQLAVFENECTERNLRYKLLGKSGFWGQREVKDVCAIVGAVVKPTDANILGVLRARSTATKYIRKTDAPQHKCPATILKEMQESEPGTCLNQLLMRYSGDSTDAVRNLSWMLRDLRSETRQMNGTVGVQRIIERFGVLDSYEEDDNKDENIDNDPRENILKMLEFASRKGSATAFYDWIQKVQRGLRARTDCLTLSTIHQSKGKEWKYVFVVGVNQDVLPHAKGDPEEERRIFFVACSRAAKALHVSASGVASDLIRHKLPENGLGVTVDPWEGYELLRD
jgi:superfamily I DNA/RNA helicase